MNPLPPWSSDLDWPANLAPFQPFNPDIQSAPYAHYAWLRRCAPAVRAGLPEAPLYIVSRFEDVRRGLRDADAFSSEPSKTVKIPGFILNLDPPAHTVLRQSVQRAFTPRAMAALQPVIADLVAARWHRVLEKGGGELMSEFASPLTIAVISTVLGVGVEQSAQMRQWTTETIDYMGALFRGVPNSAANSAGLDNILAYIGEVLDRASESQDDTVVANLARLRGEGVLTRAEAAGFATMLFMAGHETTTLLTGNCLDFFCRSPQNLALLTGCETPRPFLDEMLRFNPPVHRLSRVARYDTELGGYRVPEGAHVRFLIASANRDEAQFPDPDTFDAARNNATALGFGNGIHMCIGSWLARMEVGLILETLAKTTAALAYDSRWPRVPLSGGAFATSGLHSLGVRVKGA